jgi:hypothetical protein
VSGELLAVAAEGTDATDVREATERELDEVCAELGDDERRVLLALARRLLAGQRTYGLLSVATDGRDWLRERSEELEDVLVYTAIAEVAAASRGGT